MEQKATNIVWHGTAVTKAERSKQKNQKPVILWFTGLSGSGKSTIANALESKLHSMGYHTYLLDGDNVRHGLNKNLGFSDEDRVENIRRIGEVAKLFVDAGTIVMTAFISPFRADRNMVRGIVGADEFIEVYVDTPLDVCEQRDPKGLYQKARAGQIKNFTGLDSPYEAPDKPEITLKTAEQTIDQSVEQIVSNLKQRSLLSS
jgi:adenylylsulfate kinase